MINNKSLGIQRRRVQNLEDYLAEHVDAVELPANHYFTNNGNSLDVCCREFFMPKGIVITGTLYKQELFLVLAKGKMLVIEGDHSIEVQAPLLIKNLNGTKNSWYSLEDVLIYGFIPNPTNSRNLHDIINPFGVAAEIQGMGENKQQINTRKRRLEHEIRGQGI